MCGAQRAVSRLTWSLGSLLGGCVLALGLDGRRVEDPGGGAVFAEVVLQAFDGAIQLAGPDLEVDVHEICRGKQRYIRTFAGDQSIQFLLLKAQ